jgi:hypothetical protein
MSRTHAFFRPVPADFRDPPEFDRRGLPDFRMLCVSIRSFPVKALGRLLVIWGTLLPLMILPSTADRIDEKVAILNIRLDREASIGWIAVNYDTVMILGLFVIGVGLSLQSLAAPVARSALQRST